MSDQRLRIPVLLILCSVVLFAACTRTASTPPPSVGEETPSDDVTIDDTQLTMDAVRSLILTQTAQAEFGGEATATPTADLTLSPDESGDETQQAAAATATPTLGGVVEYTVQPGDWIWKIARAYDVDPQEIIDFNNLTSPSQLQPGMVLKIPISSPPTHTPEPDETELVDGTPTTATPSSSGTIHIVQPGEWIWQIARIYGVDPQAIIDANNLADPSSISPGQKLIIP